jgi:hypothetical protein
MGSKIKIDSYTNERQVQDLTELNLVRIALAEIPSFSVS